MHWIIAGLGNPDQEYVGTRHNVGRDLLTALQKKEGAKGRLFGKKVVLATPDVYMNNSGGPLKKLAPTKKEAEHLVVVHDDLDLPLGAVKISFGSGSGGHRGVESVIKALKTRDFARVRIGISPATPSGKLKKPAAEKIVDFVLGAFRAPEQDKLKKARKRAAEALELIVTEGLTAAMNVVNTSR